jgi:hypothetical protein
MSINNSQRFLFAPELAATMTGSFTPIGVLAFNPVVIIFDNQGTDSVAISVDEGNTTWRTFPGGEALVLDLRANAGVAPNGTFDLGTEFSGNGAGGVFSISYIYAKEIGS